MAGYITTWPRQGRRVMAMSSLSILLCLWLGLSAAYLFYIYVSYRVKQQQWRWPKLNTKNILHSYWNKEVFQRQISRIVHFKWQSFILKLNNILKHFKFAEKIDNFCEHCSCWLLSNMAQCYKTSCGIIFILT